MMRMRLAAGSLMILLLGFLATSPATSKPANGLDKRVSLETRWWNQHEFAWRLAEATDLRWAIVDGISGRAQAGGLEQPAATLAEQFTQQTGITLEVINDILVAHRPDEARREELEAGLLEGGDEAVRAAWLLGWLKDARAWPALAEAAAGDDLAVALSAANALRRLDGEENFEIKRWIPSGGERQGTLFYSRESPLDSGLSQVPLGACFPNALTLEQAQTLAGSPYVPLREAAARLAAGLADGKELAETLSSDPSLTVRQAADRALRAWEQPGPYRDRPVLKPDLEEHRKAWEEGGRARRSAAPWLAAFGSDDDLRKLIEEGGGEEGLIHRPGGELVAEAYRKSLASGRPGPYSSEMVRWRNAKYVLAMMFDGEKLAEELGPYLGNDHWSLSSELLLARFAGPPALPHFTDEVFERRGHVAPTAVGYIGGPDGVARIALLLGGDSLNTAVSAALGLGESGQLSAIEPLIGALGSPNRVLRSRAALGLGRIGGPEAARALAELIEKEEEYLPRRSAWAMLREINTGDEAHTALLEAVEEELDAFVPSYNPVNPRFGDDFPEGELVVLERIFTLAGVGEIRCASDPYAGVWTFYGGCSGGYNNQFQGFDVASGEWFTIRPPEMTGLFYNESRAGGGCSRGMAYDPKGRKFWINNATRAPRGASFSNWAMVFSGPNSCSYDLATDRFEGPFPEPDGSQGTYFVADTSRGHIYSEVMATSRDPGATTQVIDTADARLKELEFEGLPGGLDAFYVHEMAGYDPVSDLILREIREHGFKRGRQPEEDFGLWLLDPANGTARKARNPLPGGRANNNPSGTQLMFDNLNREMIAFRDSGAYVFERPTESWRKIADGDRWFYVHAFDPQHNVFIGSGGRFNLWLAAFRLKDVPEGTKAFFGADE